MFKRFTANKLRVIYFGVLTLCLVVGISLVINPGRTTESVVVGDKNQVASQEMAIAETDQSVLAAETIDTAQPAQMAPITNQDTLQKSTTSDKTTIVQNPQSATSPSAAPPDPGLPDPVAAQPAQNLTVYLSVNDNYMGSVDVEAGSDHCAVLSQALKDGIIKSLDMRYYAQFKTQGVYAIDGQGSSDAIWWTFKVNGKSPPAGCSYVQVKDGDQVKWEYVRS